MRYQAQRRLGRRVGRSIGSGRGGRAAGRMNQGVAGGVGFDLVGTVRNFKRAPVADGQDVFGCFPGRSRGRRRSKLEWFVQPWTKEGSGNRG